MLKKKNSIKCGMLKTNIYINVKIFLLKTYIWSKALYGCVSWKIGKNDGKNIETLELWCFKESEV